MTRTLNTECALLSQVLQSNRRPQVYRHHVFYQAATRAVRAVTNLRTEKKAAKKNSAAIVKRWVHVHAMLQRAVEAATQELAAQRIDTISLSLLLIAVCSRLGCLVGRRMVERVGASRCIRLWGESYVARLTTTSSSSPTTSAEENAGAHTRTKERNQSTGQRTVTPRKRAPMRTKRTRKGKGMGSIGELLDSTLR